MITELMNTLVEKAQVQIKAAQRGLDSTETELKEMIETSEGAKK